MTLLKDSLDTLKGYGVVLKEAATTTTKDLADASVSAIADVIRNAGKPSSAVPETHKAVAKGTDANGSTVIPLPTNPAAPVSPGAVAQAGKEAGLPTWAIVLLVLSGVAVVGGVIYVVAK